MEIISYHKSLCFGYFQLLEVGLRHLLLQLRQLVKVSNHVCLQTISTCLGCLLYAKPSRYIIDCLQCTDLLCDVQSILFLYNI